MIFYLIGIDHNTTPFKIREKISFNRDDILGYWKWVSPANTAILFTCNRVEIYGVADTFKEAEHLQKKFTTLFENLFSNAYVIYGKENIFRHGLKLATGLESQLQGETQIIQQLRDWINKNNFNDFLLYLWQDILLTATKIKQQIDVKENVPSIAELVFEDLSKKTTNKNNTNVMVVGTGKIAQLIAENKPGNISLLFVARKKRKKAQAFADLVDGGALLLEEIPEGLIDIDAIISATSSPHYALKLKHFKDIANKRKRNIYIYDLAMPRDVDPEVAQIGFNKIINIEQVISQRNFKSTYLKEFVKETLKLIEIKTDDYRRENETSNRIKTEQACVITS